MALPPDHRPPASPAAPLVRAPRTRWQGRAALVVLSLAVAGVGISATVVIFPAQVHQVLGLAGGVHFFLAGVLATLLSPLLRWWAGRRGLLADPLSQRLTTAARQVTHVTWAVVVLLLAVGLFT